MSIEESFQSPIILLNAQRSGRGRQCFPHSFVNEWFSNHAVSWEPSSHPEANTFGDSKETVADRHSADADAQVARGSRVAALP